MSRAKYPEDDATSHRRVDDTMCGRYSVSAPADLIAETFGLDAATVPDLPPRWNVAPTQEAPVVREVEGERRLDQLRWGLVPGGAKDISVGARMINARSETAATLAAFRESLRRRRCLVPADGFYEWRATPGGRQPYHIRFADRRLFAMAGLWSRWKPPGRDPLESFTILTCPPSEAVSSLHDRMPVILPHELWNEWLTAELPRGPEDNAAVQQLLRLLVPWSAAGRAEGELEVVPVSRFVNTATHEGEECVRVVEPAAGAPQLSLF